MSECPKDKAERLRCEYEQAAMEAQMLEYGVKEGDKYIVSDGSRVLQVTGFDFASDGQYLVGDMFIKGIKIPIIDICGNENWMKVVLDG